MSEDDIEGVVDTLSDEVTPETATTEGEGNDTATAPVSGEGEDTSTAAEGEGENQTPEGEDGEDKPDPDKEADETETTRSQRRRRQRREHLETLERDKAALTNQVAKLKERLDKLEAPDAADFENPDDYTAAAAAHATRKANLEDQIEEGADADQAVDTARQAVRSDAFKDASADARGRYADYDKVALGSHWTPTPVMMDVILDSDRSADLAYYLGANPEEADRIARLSPAQQAVALGRIEASKLPDLKPKPAPQSQAPAPIKPVRPVSAAAEKSPTEMSYDEYSAWRRRNEPKK